MIGRTVTLAVFCAFSLPLCAFDAKDWGVRCWDATTRTWTDRGIDAMTVASDGNVTKVTNTSGIHKHAHFIFPADLSGDFTFMIELKGGYELGFLNRAGKDEMLYLELGESEGFATFELSRKGTRFTIKQNGRERPLVHFRFDYGDECLLTLAIKDGESVEIRNYSFESSSE